MAFGLALPFGAVLWDRSDVLELEWYVLASESWDFLGSHTDQQHPRPKCGLEYVVRAEVEGLAAVIVAGRTVDDVELVVDGQRSVDQPQRDGYFLALRRCEKVMKAELTMGHETVNLMPSDGV